MKANELLLRPLNLNDKESFMEAVDLAKGDLFELFPKYTDITFESYVEFLLKKEKNEFVPVGRVKESFYYGFFNNSIIGRLSLRHDLTENLLNVGGHIGYFVLSKYRNKGFATEMLRQALSFAKNFELTEVLLTCDDSNWASRQVIEKMGGQLENIYSSAELSEPKRRYWITLN